MIRVVFIQLIFIVLTVSAYAKNFYVDPVHGSNTNNGSELAPWKSLQYLLDEGLIESRDWDSRPYSSSSNLVGKNNGAPIKAGDTIYLRSGNYGELTVISYYNASPITIAAESGENPIFRNILIRSSSNWKIRGLHIDASAYPQASFSRLISLDSHSWTGPVHSVEVNGCTLVSIPDSSGWSREDWNTKAKSGIGVSGWNMKIEGNILRNVDFGISVGARNSLVRRNLIENFSGDGLRGLGDYTVFEDNTVKNCYDVNDNHDDGFQSWSVGSDGKVGTGKVKGIVLRRNTIINYEDPNQPFRGTLQGIGCFDGMFEDWIVEGNRIKVDHWHGISLYGAIGSIIRDNVVTDLNSSRPGPPWIYLNSHKNGTPSRNNEVTCNISPKILADNSNGNIVRYNTLSETGGPRHSSCPPLAGVSPFLPLLLRDDQR